MNIVQQARVLRYPWLITYYDLDERDQLWVTMNGMFSFITNPSESVCKHAIILKPENIKFVLHPSKELQKECLERDPDSIVYIENYDEMVVAEVLAKNPEIICKIQKPSKTLILLYLHLTQNNVNKKALLELLRSGIRDWDVANIVVKELFKDDEDMLEEWNFTIRKEKLAKLLRK